MKTKIFNRVIILLISLITISLTACDKTVTYADLLDQERKSISKFLKYGGIYTEELPADTSKIKVSGTRNAISTKVPFYELENDVYMQVIDKGNGRIINEGERVYFRFLRVNLNTWATAPYDIKMFDLNNGGVGNFYYPDINEYCFDYVKDYNVPMSQYYDFGLGIEYPLAHLYDRAKVYLILPSKVGFSESVSSVVPYLYYIEYTIAKN
ncbi:MAG: DUF4827 domain-containing protein [Bacteroidales bacterium]|nr:DUF4827 domain-containing protein [Bacteroidales bacterium]